LSEDCMFEVGSKNSDLKFGKDIVIRRNLKNFVNNFTRYNLGN